MADFTKAPDVSGHVAPQERIKELWTNQKTLADGIAAVLPAFTVADNGKVLKIVDGELAWAADATGA